MNSTMLNEFRAEVAITKRILERVPEEKLTWKPHEKSMALGQLALHLATIPGGIASIAQQDSFDVLNASFVPQQPKSKQEIMSRLRTERPWCGKISIGADG